MKKLSWENHIEIICKKDGAGIAVIKLVKSFVSKDTLQVLYKAIVQPYFEFLITVVLYARDNCGKVLKEKIQKYQSRAARVIVYQCTRVRLFKIDIYLQNFK